MSFVVRIESSGHEMTAEPSETVLEAALRQGIHLPYSCRGGQCGVCKATLLAGEVDYGLTPPAALSPAEQKAGVALLCKALPRSDLHLQVREVKQAKDIQVRILPCRVEKKELLAPEVIRLFLRLPASERLPFLAGQYIEFLLPENRRRAFSLANPPQHDELLELHIRQVAGGQFSSQVFQEMPEKSILRIQGPLGSFTFQEESDRPAILMAGGTGFAPVKAILEYAFLEGVKRPLHLYWGARARPDLYLDELPRQWTQQYPNFRYTPVLSEPNIADNWEGRTGLVHSAVMTDYPDLSRYEIYACGPPPLVAAGLDAFAACGLPRQYYYSDSFEYAKDPSNVAST
ncbi:CDP-4-dehydro-6-deoxyglucose reductase, E3 [Gammaproteobacteria bacterium]